MYFTDYFKLRRVGCKAQLSRRSWFLEFGMRDGCSSADGQTVAVPCKSLKQSPGALNKE
jgi:hypothetical protein